MTRREELAAQIRARQWFHTMVLDDGLVTRGDSPESNVIARSIPDVRGRSVLDIGAWDGKYAFQAERAGASRVVALDHYVWRIDGAARDRYYQECKAQGVLPDPSLVAGGFLLDEGLPGKAGFDLAHEYLDSKVEAVVDDFMTMDLRDLGSFDVVFYFGVLYHMLDPLGALKRLRAVTGEVAVIETSGVIVPGYARASLLSFYADDELNRDYSNWFAPSARALDAMCRAAGFATVEIKAQDPLPRLRSFFRRQPVFTRIVAHAFP